jgi:hypothetical protein
MGRVPGILLATPAVYPTDRPDGRFGGSTILIGLAKPLVRPTLDLKHHP